MTKNLIAIALIASAGLALTACGSGEPAPAAGHEAAAAEAPAHASSSAGLPAGNVEAGEKLATTKNAKTGQSCVDCHGAEGNAPIDASYPKLGGQYHDYIAHSLQGYRDGRRDHALMSSQAAELTDQQIADLGAYFGTRPSQLRDLHGTTD
jgi:cytochrome c553